MTSMKKNMNGITNIEPGTNPYPRSKHFGRLKCVLNMKKYPLHIVRDYVGRGQPATMPMDNRNLEAFLISEKHACA